MAEDELEKSVQNIKDPSARKKAYYTAQREQAESKASKGDQGAARTASRVEAKLGNKDKGQYYASEAMYGKPLTDFGTALNKVGKVAGQALEFAVPEAKGASLARGLVPRATEAAESGLSNLGRKASQWLGRAKPVAKKLEGGPRKVTGQARKMLKGGEEAAPAKETQKALPSKGAQKALPRPRNAKDPTGKELQPAGRAKSSPAKREGKMSPRYNPQTGKSVGRENAKSGFGIQKRWADRAERNTKMDEVAKMNQQAAKQSPRSRGLRSNEALGKPGSSKKGNYKSAKLTARGS